MPVRDGNPIPHGDAITVSHEHIGSHGQPYTHRHAISHADVDPNAVTSAYPGSDRLAHWNAIIGCLPVAHRD